MQCLTNAAATAGELVHVGRVLEEQEKGDTRAEAVSEPKASESWMLFFKQPVEG
jgi:hypothetical protein